MGIMNMHDYKSMLARGRTIDDKTQPDNSLGNLSLVQELNKRHDNVLGFVKQSNTRVHKVMYGGTGGPLVFL